MDLEQRKQNSETRIFKAVFPNTTNHYDTLFGGTAMQLMDEVAFIAATRFSRQRMVTVSSDRIDFKTDSGRQYRRTNWSRDLHRQYKCQSEGGDIHRTNVFRTQRESNLR